jgi:hypothetical protein
MEALTKITLPGDPALGSEATTKQYVDKQAAGFPPDGQLIKDDPAADSIYARGPIRIRYWMQGVNAVPPLDTQGIGVPDVVQDACNRYLVAWHVYTDLIGLRSPFLSPRFLDAGRDIQYVRVSFLAEPQAGDTSTSLAYQSPNMNADGITGYLVIAQAIGAPAPATTPIHELFHLFQYGYGRMTNGWYLEGLARWSEDMFTRRTYPAKSRKQLLDMFEDPRLWHGDSANGITGLKNRAYSAGEHFWHPLTECLRSVAPVSIPQSDPYMRIKRADGGPLFVDNPETRDWDFGGAGILPFFFEQYERQAVRCQLEQGYASWDDSNNRTSGFNNQYIRAAVEKILEVA